VNVFFFKFTSDYSSPEHADTASNPRAGLCEGHRQRVLTRQEGREGSRAGAGGVGRLAWAQHVRQKQRLSNLTVPRHTSQRRRQTTESRGLHGNGELRKYRGIRGFTAVMGLNMAVINQKIINQFVAHKAAQ